MSSSLRAALPAGYDPRAGFRGIRADDPPPISLRSMTDQAYVIIPGPDMSAGHVYATKMKVVVWGDGHWWFTCKLDDTSVVFGDNFAVGFSIEDGDFGKVLIGSLGADVSRMPQHLRLQSQGREEGLQRRFSRVGRPGQTKFRLRQSDDLVQVFGDLGEDLKWLGRKLVLMASYDSTATGTDAEHDPSVPNWNDGGSEGQGGNP